MLPVKRAYEKSAWTKFQSSSLSGNFTSDHRANTGSHDAACDRCLVSPIRGVRFHCIQCVDYDLCAMCHSQQRAGDHIAGHQFTQIQCVNGVPSALGHGPNSFYDPALIASPGQQSWIAGDLYNGPNANMLSTQPAHLCMGTNPVTGIPIRCAQFGPTDSTWWSQQPTQNWAQQHWGAAPTQMAVNSQGQLQVRMLHWLCSTPSTHI